MNERSDWATLRDARMADPEAREAYESARRAAELGDAVRGLRTELGLTQKQLGQRAHFTQSAVARLEAGDVMPTLRVLQRIADALGAELDVSLRRPAKSAPVVSTAKPVHC